MKVKVEFPVNSKGLNLNVRTPSGETRVTDILADDEGWTSVMENTYFPSDVLDNIVDKETSEFYKTWLLQLVAKGHIMRFEN